MLICGSGMVHLSTETQDRYSTEGRGRAFKAERSLCEDNLPIVPEYAKSPLPAKRVPVSTFPTTRGGWLTEMGKVSWAGQPRATAECSSPVLEDATSEQSCSDHTGSSTFA